MSGLKTRIACVVREVTTDGARLQVDLPGEVPKRFVLFIDMDGFASECELVDRGPDEVTIRFRAPEKAPDVPQAISTIGAPAASGVAPDKRKKALMSCRLPPIVIAEDDEDDRWMIQDAFRECGSAPPLEFVRDGQELLDYLAGNGPFEGKPRPGLILLDLNMPRIDGRKALVRIKGNPDWRSIPLMILSTSDAEIDMKQTKSLGASSFLRKPSTFDELVSLSRSLKKFWSVVALNAPRDEEMSKAS